MHPKSIDNLERQNKLAALIIIALSVAVIPKFCTGQEVTPIVARIEFQGNEAFSSSILKNEMRTTEGQPEDSFQLARDAERVIQYFNDNGYPDAKLVETRRIPNLKHPRLLTYIFVVQEGTPYTISRVEIQGAQKIGAKKVSQVIVVKPNQIRMMALIYYSEFLIRQLYATSGYIYCKVDHKIDSLPGLENSQLLTFLIDEGSQVRVGTVTVKGNRGVRLAIITREIVIKPGDLFDPGRAYESQRRIYGTGLFKDVKFDMVGEEEKKDVIDLVFQVVEDRPKWVAFGGGYQSPDRMSVYVNWGHDNIFNNGQKLQLESMYSFNLQKEKEENFGITHSEPYLFSSPFHGQLHLFHHRVYAKSYDIIESGGDSKVGRYIGKSIEAYAGYKFKTASVKTFAEVDTSLSAITNSISLTGSRDTRDFIFDPKKGTLTGVRVEYAGGILGGDNYFYRAIGDVSAFYNPLGSIVFAVRARGGFIKPFANRSVPFEERFALRGSDAVRGYAEQDLTQGANYLQTYNFEMRFPLFRIYTRYVGLAYFVDMGKVSNDIKEVRISNLDIGAGVGLRAETPIGPFRLDYARNITGASQTDRGRIYFGIGNMF